MYTTVSTTILLSSLLATTHAFVPFSIQPLPTDLDTEVWVPIATLDAITPDATPAPTPAPEFQILPVLDANFIPELKPRQAAGAAPQVTQVSPITTYYINSLVGPGSFAQVPVVYTQLFVPIPDQWESPGVGTIGLGTIQGEIGVVKTKRSLPTQAPLAADVTSGGGLVQSGHTKENSEPVPLMDKLRKAGKTIQDELSALLKKEKKQPMEMLRVGEDEQEMASLSKETKTSPLASEDNDDSTALTPLQREQKKTGASTHSSVVANDAPVFQAGSLIVLAVSIATLCANYL